MEEFGSENTEDGVGECSEAVDEVVSSSIGRSRMSEFPEEIQIRDGSYHFA